MNVNWNPRVISLIVAILVVTGTIFSNVPKVSEWEELLWWLPEDTETIVVINESFKAPLPQISLGDVSAGPTNADEGNTAALRNTDSVSTGKISHPAQRFQSFLGSQFVNSNSASIARMLGGSEIRCAIQGGRNFGTPKRFGMGPFQGCQIFKFAPDCLAQVDQAMKMYFDKADKKIVVEGQSVAVIKEKMDEDEWTFLYCRPRPDILVSATNEKYLEVLLQRIRKKAPTRALPLELPEWKQLDVKAPFWGLRHYRREFAQTDPSSPYYRRPGGEVTDNNAVGFAFWFTSGNTLVANNRYLSGKDSPVVDLVKGWKMPNEGLTPKICKIAPGVAEIVFAIDNERTAQSYFTTLLINLGFGIFV